MRAVIEELPDEERTVIQMRFGLDGDRDPVSIRETARRLDLRPRTSSGSSAARSRSSP